MGFLCALCFFLLDFYRTPPKEKVLLWVLLGSMGLMGFIFFCLQKPQEKKSLKRLRASCTLLLEAAQTVAVVKRWRFVFTLPKNGQIYRSDQTDTRICKSPHRSTVASAHN